MRLAPIHHTADEPWVQLRNLAYHPLLYRKMVGTAAPNARPGSFVTVYDRYGQVFGRGFYNPQSQIALRLLTFAESTPDTRPAAELITERITAAVALRHNVLKLTDLTDAYRLVHAEGDGLSGLIADRYGSYVVVELFSLGMYRQLPVVRAALETHFPGVRILVRADDRIQQAEGFALPAEAPPADGPPRDHRTVVTENGVRFQVDFAGSHKTGFFCDQRDNRALLAQFTAGAEMLDLCSYTGGFGITAAKVGAAKSVLCVDLDEYAVALVKRNAGINGLANRVEATQADAFAYCRQLAANHRQFDVVVLDPAKLIASRDEFDEGRAKYFDLNKLAIPLVRPGGVFLSCSCSGLLDESEFVGVVRGAARSAQRRLQILSIRGAGADHPVMADCPESRYLKAVICRVGQPGVPSAKSVT